jgi:hypothetical protein
MVYVHMSGICEVEAARLRRSAHLSRSQINLAKRGAAIFGAGLLVGSSVRVSEFTLASAGASADFFRLSIARAARSVCSRRNSLICHQPATKLSVPALTGGAIDGA